MTVPTTRPSCSHTLKTEMGVILDSSPNREMNASEWMHYHENFLLVLFACATFASCETQIQRWHTNVVVGHNTLATDIKTTQVNRMTKSNNTGHPLPAQWKTGTDIPSMHREHGCQKHPKQVNILCISEWLRHWNTWSTQPFISPEHKPFMPIISKWFSCTVALRHPYPYIRWRCVQNYAMPDP